MRLAEKCMMELRDNINVECKEFSRIHLNDGTRYWDLCDGIYAKMKVVSVEIWGLAKLTGNEEWIRVEEAFAATWTKYEW